MKTSLFILLFLLGKPSNDELKNYLSCHFFEAPFTEFTNEIYHQTGIKVFYDDALVAQLKVTINADSISVQNALEVVLKGTGIEISSWHNNFILLSKEKLITSLPELAQKSENKDTSTAYQLGSNNTDSKYITTRKANAIQTIRIGKNETNGNKQNVKVHGKIIDKESGAPLLDATFLIAEIGKGIATDKNGYFTLVLNAGKYNATIGSLGHEKKKISIEVLSDGEINIELKKEDLLIDEVMVYGDLQTNIKLKEPGLERIAAKTIKEIPMMMGERDILKVSSLLPGIVSVGEGLAGINVRGSSSDQNAFYLDKIPIYNTSHLFGFLPSFNSDIIKDFSIYKGYIPAQFGGRLSSVFNITTHEANSKHFTAHGGISPVTAYITAEGPIIKDKLSVLLSTRYSYSDWILSKIKDPSIKNSSTAFNDFTASLNYKLKKSQLSILTYKSHDKVRFSDINEYQYSNLGGSVNLNHVFNSSIKGDFTIIGSEYSFNTTDNQIEATAYKHNYKLGHYEFRSDINHIINDKTNLDYGANFILYKLDKGLVKPYGNYSLINPINRGKEQGVESAIYITDKYTILPQLTLSIGLRQSFFTSIGPQSVYTYNNDTPREERYITDTLNYASDKPLKWYVSPEIRSTINFQTDRNGSIKLAFNQMQQNLFMLSNTVTVAPNTQWKLADYNLKPSKSMQFSFGIFRNIPKEGLETSVEVYFKKTYNYSEFKDGANFLTSSAVETSILQGDQKAYGIEFFIKRSGKKLNGWLSYTYSRSIVHIDGPNIWDRINEGDPYPSNFDIPHAMNALINYRFNRRLTFSTLTTYQTGRPSTFLQSLYYVKGRQYVDYSKRNQYHIPDYFRIDASITIEGNLKKNKFIHSSFMISVYNLTGRKNAYSVYYKSNEQQIYCYKYSVIGVPLVTVTWLFKLGNYDSD